MLKIQKIEVVRECDSDPDTSYKGGNRMNAVMATRHLETALRHIKNNNQREASRHAEFGCSYINPGQFSPSLRCKCWGVVFEDRKGGTTYRNNMTYRQASAVMSGILDAPNADKIVRSVAVVAEHNSINRQERG